jgi:hypothetical protein
MKTLKFFQKPLGSLAVSRYIYLQYFGLSVIGLPLIFPADLGKQNDRHCGRSPECLQRASVNFCGRWGLPRKSGEILGTRDALREILTTSRTSFLRGANFISVVVK